MQKTSYYITSHLALFIHAISARLHAAWENLIPVGYQDENGFHLGVKRASQDNTWPTVD